MKRHRKYITPSLLLLALTALAGCGDIALNNLGGSGVSGTVKGKSFSDAAASAESNGDGSFIITIADTFEYDCTASNGLPENYLTVVVDDVREAPMELQASSVVFFNDFENGVGTSEGATSGTVMIDSISTFSIEGSLDAFSADSNVSGSFSADICN